MVNRKVQFSGLAGALSVVIIWAIKQWGQVEMPPEVASGVTTVLSFITGYFVTEPQ